MNDPAEMSWKAFTIRLIEALRWPAAFVAAVVILKEPFAKLIEWFTHSSLG